MMAQQKLNKRTTADAQRNNPGGYYLVQRSDGQLRCSCGAELIKNDDQSYVCTGGYPIYRPQDGDIIKDKWGNVYFRQKPHGDENKKAKKRGEQGVVLESAPLSDGTVTVSIPDMIASGDNPFIRAFTDNNEGGDG